MLLVVGLGNPGARYESTRHNIGFKIVEALAGSAAWTERFKGNFCLINDAHKLGVLKPSTFMNLSGQSVRAASDFYKIAPADVLVVHDELDVPWRQLRLKLGGGEAGHNGLRSVTEHLGTRDYYRLRVGIGRPPPEFQGSGADFVLQAFAPVQKAELPDFIAEGVAAIRLFIERGASQAMNEVNRKR
ncbi:MAG TPA: aminoacyl-tRNA hydrolase [Polyangiaceae bacterium]|jgi:PTH1 family peptidyl-tRNA hydrolase|nr:aminoacyl-tRNA hydrolase [Polyangiaceae bacterium]